MSPNEKNPAPEVLQPKTAGDEDKKPADTDTTQQEPVENHSSRRMTYRPSHKATFMGLGVVVGILVINALVLAFIMKTQDEEAKKAQQTVTLSSTQLDKLGVSRNDVGTSGSLLTVGPEAKFQNKVTIAGSLSVAGGLQLNGTFTVPEARITKLQAGETALQSLNVNGDGTISNLILRRDLTVAGTSRLQGPVILGGLLTVNNSAVVVGNLSIGGTLSAREFQANSLTSVTTLTIGGHIITKGNAPGVSKGGAAGTFGTVSISGNDAAGTVRVNIGAGGSGVGTLADVGFHSGYSTIPHVVVTPIGGPVPNLYINRSAGGFSIMTGSSIPIGSYQFDYVVMQ